MDQEELVEPTSSPEAEDPTEAMEALRLQNEDLRRQIREARLFREQLEQRQTQAAVLQALIRHGAHPDAARLLTGQVTDARLDEEGRLVDEEKLMTRVRQEWSSLFITTVTEGTPRVSPPITGEYITGDMLRSLSPDEINRHWTMVAEALQQYR